MRSYQFLVNPLSGGGAAPGAVVPVARALRDAGAQVDVTYSPGPSAMAELTAGAVARDAVVVGVGGDGMLSSLAGEVAGLGGTLGLVPAGRGNDFARMVGLPSDPDEVARTLLSAEERPVDLISVSHGGSEHVVAGSVYAGVDARAAEIVHGMRRVPRKLQYPFAAVRAIATFTPRDYELVIDGREYAVRAATVVVANSAYYGSGMRVAPSASVDDGLLDVVVVGASGRVATMRAFPSIYDGSHVERDEVQVLTGREITIAAAPTVSMGADGEPLGLLGRDGGAGRTSGLERNGGVLRNGGEARIGVMPGALRLLRP